MNSIRPVAYSGGGYDVVGGFGDDGFVDSDYKPTQGKTGGIDTRDPMKAPDGSTIVFQDPLQADFLGIPIDQKYVFGEAKMPSSGQIVRGVLAGIVDPFDTGASRGTQDKIQQEIDTRNAMVMKRAEILTYYDKVLGYHIPVRVAVAGVGGKAAKVLVPKAISIDIPEIPNMFMFFPSSTTIRPPEMSGWTNEQMVGFAMDNGPNGYAVYLNNGGEPIDAIDEVVQKVSKDPKHAESVKEVRSIKAKMQPRQQQLEEEKYEFEDEDDLTPEATVEEERLMDEEIKQFMLDYEEELANMPGDSTVQEINTALGDYSDIEAFEKEYKEEIDNLTKWKIYNKVTAGLGYSNKANNNAKSDIYKTKGGQQWVEDYMKKNGKPKTAEDTQRMRDAWKKAYPHGETNKASADYPAVPKYVKPQPKPTGRVPDAMNQQRPPTKPASDPVKPPKPSTPPEQMLSQREATVTEMVRRGMSLEDAVRAYDYVVDNNLTFSIDPKKPGDVNFDPSTGKVSGIPTSYTIDPSQHKDDPVMTITTDPTTGLRTATASEESPPGGHGGEEEKKVPTDDKKTSTSSPEDDPDFSRTKIDTGEPTDDDGKTKPRPVPPVVPLGPDGKPPEEPKPPRKPKVAEDDPVDPSKPAVADETAVGYKRPEYFIGGQDILKTTGKERLEEIKDWDLFDLPIPDSADVSNPLYIKNWREDINRFYEAKYSNLNTFSNILKTEDKAFLEPAYSTPIRPIQHERPERYKAMRPFMRPVDVKTPFHDPFDRRLEGQFADAYRRGESESSEILRRGTNIYPDMANQFIATPRYPTAQQSVSMIDIMMGQK
jgi:hypothetical protein